MPLTETETELRAWIDRLAIQELINRYADALTRADWDQFELTLARDVVWESAALGVRVEGRAPFVAMVSGMSPGLEAWIQMAQCSIRITGPDSAEAITTIHEIVRGEVPAASGDGGEAVNEAVNREVYGVSHDNVVRIDGEWKFTHRLFVPIYIATGAVTGDVITERAALLRPN
jgi:hypothetical protein